VIGGGNISAAVSAAASGMDRASGDYMGMLATVINSLACKAPWNPSLQTVYSQPPDDDRLRALYPPSRARHMEKGRVVISPPAPAIRSSRRNTAAALRAAR